MSVYVAINKAYVFESDEEAHINADELSDLSDVFDDDEMVTTKAPAVQASSGISLNDIPYDRDPKWINVPTTSRKKGTLVNPNAAVKLLKNVEAITAGNAHEVAKLDEHYKKLDEKKKASDSRASHRKRDTEDNQGPQASRRADYNRSRHADARTEDRAHAHPQQTQMAKVDGEERRENRRGKRGQGRQGPAVPPQHNTPPPEMFPNPPAPPAFQNPYQSYGEYRPEQSSRRGQKAYQAEYYPPPLPSAFPPPTSHSPPPSHNNSITNAASLNPFAQEFVPSFLTR